jgi:hypothetical protein
MSQVSENQSPPAPLCGPTDTMELIGRCDGTGRNMDRRDWIYVAVHRSYGLWTHVYDVVRLPGCSRTEIRLIRVMAGDRLDEARAWALAAREDDPAGPAQSTARNGDGNGWSHERCEHRFPAIEDGGGVTAGNGIEHGKHLPAVYAGDGATRCLHGGAFGSDLVQRSLIPKGGAAMNIRVEHKEKALESIDGSVAPEAKRSGCAQTVVSARLRQTGLFGTTGG